VSTVTGGPAAARGATGVIAAKSNKDGAKTAVTINYYA
jgi:hypothetical protein